MDYAYAEWQLTQYFVAQGSSLLQAQQQAVAWIGQKVQTQAAYLAYIDVFWALMLIFCRGHSARARPAQREARRTGSDAH